MMNYYSALDRGNESIDDGVNLKMPSGSAMPWGNRDYDINLLVADKAWDQSGQLWFNPFNTDGFIADRLTVNWQWKPTLDVRARRYRFRILNGSVSRYLSIGIVKECPASDKTCDMPGPSGSGKAYKRIPFHMVANDGNIMEHSVPFDGSMDLDGDGDFQDHNAVLPTQGIAERYDIIVDFAKYGIKPGDKLFFVNTEHHDTGIGNKYRVPLADIMSEKYKATLKTDSNGKLEWTDGDPTVGKFMQINVKPYNGVDTSLDPTQYEPAHAGKPMGKQMIPLWMDRSNPDDIAKLANAIRHEFHFGRASGTDGAPWTIDADGTGGANMDPRRISSAQPLSTGPTDAGYSGDGTVQVWKLESGGGWSHPVHVHFEEGIVLKRNGLPPPEWEKWARKDVYRIGGGEDNSGTIEFAIHFREFAGTYMEHCHNTQHEDNSMLLRWDIEHPGQFQVMPTPLPTWDGVEYTPSVGLPLFRTGSGLGVSNN
jgi:FtsP/CotA-like multicopper oxidase with cupredoxin domain